MKFIQFRTCWSHGYGDWEYTPLPLGAETEDQIHEYLNDYHNPSAWSEHWRGWEWEIIDLPPKKYIEDEIKGLKLSIKYRRDRLKTFQKFLESYK